MITRTRPRVRSILRDALIVVSLALVLVPGIHLATLMFVQRGAR